MFRVELSSGAEKFLKKADDEVYSRIYNALEKLSTNPFPSDVKRVVGRKEKVFRVRVGSYRVQYSVYHSEKVVLVFDIDKRPRAY